MKEDNVFDGLFNVLDKLVSGQDLGCIALYVISRLKNHIKMCLDELLLSQDSDFTEGEMYAYLECLELILLLCGVKRDKLIELEEQYGII